MKPQTWRATVMTFSRLYRDLSTKPLTESSNALRSDAQIPQHARGFLHVGKIFLPLLAEKDFVGPVSSSEGWHQHAERQDCQGRRFFLEHRCADAIDVCS